VCPKPQRSKHMDRAGRRQCTILIRGKKENPMGKMPGIALAGFVLVGGALSGCESCSACRSNQTQAQTRIPATQTSVTMSNQSTPASQWANQPQSANAVGGTAQAAAPTGQATSMMETASGARPMGTSPTYSMPGSGANSSSTPNSFSPSYGTTPGGTTTTNNTLPNTMSPVAPAGYNPSQGSFGNSRFADVSQPSSTGTTAPRSTYQGTTGSQVSPPAFPSTSPSYPNTTGSQVSPPAFPSTSPSYPNATGSQLSPPAFPSSTPQGGASLNSTGGIQSPGLPQSRQSSYQTIYPSVPPAPPVPTMPSPGRGGDE